MFSPCCGDETTTFHNGALEKGGVFIFGWFQFSGKLPRRGCNGGSFSKKELSYDELIKRGFPFLPPPIVSLKKGAPARCSTSAQPLGRIVDNPFVLKGTIEKGRISGNGRRFLFSSPKGMTGNVPLRRAVWRTNWRKKLYFHHAVEMKQPHSITGRWKKAASLFLDDSSFLENCRVVGAREVLFQKKNYLTVIW